MDIYDNIKDILTASFSDWIKINTFIGGKIK